MDVVAALALSCVFVASFYAWPCERRFVCYAVTDMRVAALCEGVYIDRDAQVTIARRTCSLLVVAVACIVYLLTRRRDEAADAAAAAATHATLRRMTQCVCAVGKDVLRCTAATLLLFLGPLVERRAYRCVAPHARCHSNTPRHKRVRNLLVAPLVEELFFRGVLLSILRHRSARQQVVIGAAVFALAHVHHMFSIAVQHYRDVMCARRADDDGDDDATTAATSACWRVAVVRVLFLCAYTFGFGVLAGVYYVRSHSGTLLATYAAHALCNTLGCPAFAFATSWTMDWPARVSFATLYVAGVAAWVHTVVVAATS